MKAANGSRDTTEYGGHAITSHQHTLPSIPVCSGFEFGVQGPSRTPPTHQLHCIACAAFFALPGDILQAMHVAQAGETR
jgi:hypothetical protein